MKGLAAWSGAMLSLLVAVLPSQAAQKLFDIVRTDGTVVAVTDNDVKTIGEITLTTPLVGQNDGEHQATGPRLRDVLKHFSVGGTVADVIALDAYRMDVPVVDATTYDVILATKINGKALTLRDRGPAWIVYPLKDFPELMTPIFEARSVWSIKEIRMR